MAYDKTVIFQNIGKAVKKCNKIADDGGFKDALDGVMAEIATLYNDSAKERNILYRFASANRADQQALDAMVRRTVSIVSAYLTEVVRDDLAVVGRTPKDVLLGLAEAMEDAEDTVKKNTVQVLGPSSDEGNEGNGTISVEVTQQALDGNHFDVVCIDATVEGSEQWSVSSSRLGELGMAVTGVQFTSEEGGINLTITAQDTLTEMGDEQNQLDNWSFNGAEKGVNTDADGRLYVSLTDTNGVRKVSCYKDSGRTELVCEGTRSGDGEVQLQEQNSSGLTGSVTVTYIADDNDISLKLPFPFGVDDKFTFSTEITDKGKFQFFFVENFGVALPSASSGSETVPESWAE